MLDEVIENGGSVGGTDLTRQVKLGRWMKSRGYGEVMTVSLELKPLPMCRVGLDY